MRLARDGHSQSAEGLAIWNNPGTYYSGPTPQYGLCFPCLYAHYVNMMLTCHV
jgi:hypothetical protein